VKSHLDRRLGGVVAVEIALGTAHDDVDFVGGHTFEPRRQIAHRRHHALQRFAGHGRGGGGVTPAYDAPIGLEPHQRIFGASYLLKRHLDRLHHRQVYRDHFDATDLHIAVR
jgi:hypothetical protein